MSTQVATDAKPYVDLVDVGRICNNWRRTRCDVLVRVAVQTTIPWLVLGEVSLTTNKPLGRWSLNAKMANYVTDAEHDIAYVASLPLIGVQFDDLGVFHSITNLVGWIDPDGVDNFRIPPPGYNPAKHPDARTCKAYPLCRDGGGHVVVPEGYWQPTVNLELFKKVAGKRVEIRIAPVIPGEE